MKKIILFLCFTITMHNLLAQKKVAVAIKSGMGLGKLKVNDSEIGIAYSMGLESFLKLINRIKLNPAIEYKHIGYQRGSAPTKMNYVITSLPLLLYFDLENEKVKNDNIFIGVGPYIGFAVSKEKSNFNNKDKGFLIKIGTENDGTSFSVQGNFGLGYNNTVKTYSLLGTFSIGL